MKKNKLALVVGLVMLGALILISSNNNPVGAQTAPNLSFEFHRLDKTTVRPGDTLTLTYRVRNNNPQSHTGSFVETDFYPVPGLEVVSNSPQENCSGSQCKLFTLMPSTNPNPTKTITRTFRVTNDICGRGDFRDAVSYLYPQLGSSVIDERTNRFFITGCASSSITPTINFKINNSIGPLTVTSNQTLNYSLQTTGLNSCEVIVRDRDTGSEINREGVSSGDSGTFTMSEIAPVIPRVGISIDCQDNTGTVYGQEIHINVTDVVGRLTPPAPQPGSAALSWALSGLNNCFLKIVDNKNGVTLEEEDIPSSGIAELRPQDIQEILDGDIRDLVDFSDAIRRELPINATGIVICKDASGRDVALKSSIKIPKIDEPRFITAIRNYLELVESFIANTGLFNDSVVFGPTNLQNLNSCKVTVKDRSPNNNSGTSGPNLIENFFPAETIANPSDIKEFVNLSISEIVDASEELRQELPVAVTFEFSCQSNSNNPVFATINLDIPQISEPRFITQMRDLERQTPPPPPVSGTASINLSRGWNLVYGLFDISQIISTANRNDILVIYGYDSKNKRYYRMHPNTEPIPSNLDTASFINSSFWVYSNQSNFITYQLPEVQLPTNSRVLYPGWNFVGITSDYPVNFSLNNIKGSCDLNIAYYWVAGSQSWFQIPFNDSNNRDASLNLGYIVNVRNQCFLSNFPGIPTLPSVGPTPEQLERSRRALQNLF